MRATTAFNTLLDLEGVTVVGIRRQGDELKVAVRLRRKRLVCPIEGCGYSTRARFDTRPEESWWRSLDLGPWKVTVTAQLRRLDCPDHGVLVEQVPFARHRVRFTRDFEDLVVRHEALVDRVGCRAPPPGCRSSSVKLGAA